MPVSRTSKHTSRMACMAVGVRPPWSLVRARGILGHIPRFRSTKWAHTVLLLLCLLSAPLTSWAMPARPYRAAKAAGKAVGALASGGGSGSQVGWMPSRIDHFSADPRTYQQRFFLNATFYKPGAPVFLCIGGEGPGLTEDVVVTGEWAVLVCLFVHSLGGFTPNRKKEREIRSYMF